MARRRHNPPPYEIMAHIPAASVTGSVGSEPAVPDAPVRSGRVPWWSQAKQPLIFRVPRGFAVVLGLGLVALIILAYMVGHVRGRTSGQEQARMEFESEALFAANASMAPIRSPGPTAAEGGTSANGDGRPAAPTGTDPRQVGLNYLRLARLPMDEARRLAAFVKTRGVETVLDPVNNGRFYIVFAVNQGFAGSAWQSEQARAYERKMREIGRAWRVHNNSRGDDLSSMIFQKYKGG